MRTLLLLAVLALPLAGCVGDTAPTTTTTTTGMAGMDHGHMAAKTVGVAMRGNAFVNATVTLYEGDSVRWTHEDGPTVPHHVAADDGSWDSNPNCASTVPAGVPLSQVCMVGGSTYTHRFDAPGTVAYRCRVHAGMTGTVVVLPHTNMTM